MWLTFAAEPGRRNFLGVRPVPISSRNRAKIQ
jgi:hypothetical protein